MASWLKAAEDLFEVVDRRAKLVVGDNPDEPAAPATGPAVRGSQSKRSRQRAKKKQPPSEVTTPANTEKEQTTETPASREEPDGNKPLSLTEDTETNPGVPSASDDGYKQHPLGDGSTNETSLPEAISHDESKPVSDGAVAETTSSTEAVTSNSNSNNVKIEEPTDIPDGSLGSTKGVEVVTGDAPFDSNQNIISEDPGSSRTLNVSESQVPPADALDKVDAQPKGQVAPANAPSEVDAQSKDAGLASGSDIQSEKQQEPKDIASTMKVDDQLDEAQGLLQTAKSTGQSKEARLARVCAGLSSRLQEYKSENAQLEELLISERELSKSYEAQIKQLQKDLSASKGEVSRVESNMVEALAAKNAEIETLVNSVDSLKKQAALSEGNLASLQANMESIMRNRELTETRMMQALREELAAAERRSEEERAAHNSIKLSFREREVELEQRAIEASTALARIQRTADDRAAKAAELEQKVALLEVECASLNQELQDMEARVRRGQKKTPEDANQTIQVQAWQEEVERARQSQREAESKLSSMDAEVQKMRVEMAAMKRDAEHYSRQEHMELEKRYRELTDLLYYKQTQLETMASEKAAAEFQLEKEVKRFHEAQLEAERSRSSRRASSSWEEEDNDDMKTLEPLPLHHRHMAAASLQLQKAAKMLDTGAVRATRFLWRYPTARVILLFYLVFVHLFLMYLLHRLQEQADTYTSKEDAESMGLFNQTLP